MKTLMRLVMLGGAAALCGCASAPPASPQPVAANVAPSVQINPAAAAGDAAQQKASIPYGYKRTVVNGTEIFCRNDLITGSRTERHQVCYTKKQLEDMQNNTQDYINSVQRSGGEAIKTCTAGPGCN
jgi:hypothetical protein